MATIAECLVRRSPGSSSPPQHPLSSEAAACGTPRRITHPLGRSILSPASGVSTPRVPARPPPAAVLLSSCGRGPGPAIEKTTGMSMALQDSNCDPPCNAPTGMARATHLASFAITKAHTSTHHRTDRQGFVTVWTGFAAFLCTTRALTDGARIRCRSAANVYVLRTTLARGAEQCDSDHHRADWYLSIRP